jgi:hypothetical protein
MVRAVLAVGLTAAVASAQGPIRTNEPVKGRLNSGTQVDSWVIELKEDLLALRVEVKSPVTAVLVFLSRDGKAGQTLFPVNGRGWRTAGSGAGGKDLECGPEGPLAAGRYVLTVQSGNGQDIGPYTVRVLEPKLSGPKPVPAPPKPADAADDPVDALRKEIAALRRLLADLDKRLKALEQKAKK